MEPKEKAIDLYNKFYNTSSHPHHVETRQQIAKQCAMIAVDEIIEFMSPMVHSKQAYDYWDEVKEEIKKL
jgi:hypothetical protein